MLACISDDPRNESESISTLRFGQRVGSLRTSRKLAVTQAVALPPDPMAGDTTDPDHIGARRACWIETRSYGDIFARVAGVPSDPLVLYVHGSGPRNSSLQWNFLVDNLIRMRAPLYHVAIDCPGYGRSPGERQVVRSFPGSLLKDVIRSVGKSQAYSLVGSSQGACAVFNAVLEEPDISWFVAVCHPVGHDVSRYTRIQ